MAASEIPPQMANFQTFFLRDLFSCQDFAHCYFVLNFSLSAQKQQILVLRNSPNCSSVHNGITGISLAELALHNRCGTDCGKAEGRSGKSSPWRGSEAEGCSEGKPEGAA